MTDFSQSRIPKFKMFEVEQILRMKSLECGRAGGELRCREERSSETRKKSRSYEWHGLPR